MRPHFLCSYACVFFLLIMLSKTPLVASSSAPNTSPVLRIGLCKKFGKTPSIWVSCDGPFILEDAQTQKTLLHGTPSLVYSATVTTDGLILSRNDSGGINNILTAEMPITVIVTGKDLLKIALPGTDRWHHYRGTFTLKREADGTLRVINNIPLEQYLYGVIPAEIGADAPSEAMKAQAVAARTYALKNRDKFMADGFDLDDTTRCEGYDGWDGETAATDAAVDATQGLILTWHGMLIDAPYSTDCGGMTACDPTCPYLQAVRDAPLHGPDYASDDKFHTWTQNYTPDQLQAILARDPRTDVGEFAFLKLDGADASGRVTTATVEGMDGNSLTVTGPQLRQILGYDVLRSTLITLTMLPNGDYQFSGRGWGHGLGMSQDGAIAMALPPYRKNFREILSHYYIGTTLTTLKSVNLLAQTPP
jgi:stage II sporulation protein D